MCVEKVYHSSGMFLPPLLGLRTGMTPGAAGPSEDPPLPTEPVQPSRALAQAIQYNELRAAEEAEVRNQTNRLCALLIRDEEAFFAMLRAMGYTTEAYKLVYSLTKGAAECGRVRVVIPCMEFLWWWHQAAGSLHSFTKRVGHLVRLLCESDTAGVEKIARFIADMKFWYESSEMANRYTVLGNGLPPEIITPAVLRRFANAFLSEEQKAALAAHPLMTD